MASYNLVSKMPGVQKADSTTNDRFYFVLDEVGGSSDTGEVSDDNDKDEEKSNAPQEKNIPDAPLITQTQTSTSNNAILESKESSADSFAITDEIPEDMELESDHDVSNSRVEPLITVKFRDEKTSLKYRKLLLDFITANVKPTLIVSSNEEDLEFDIWGEEEERGMESFIIDATPSPHVRDFKAVPFYRQCETVITDVKPSTKQEVYKTKCFNCLGAHTMRDCPSPRDGRAIATNRAKFQSSYKPASKSSRYHLDVNQKFGCFRPGNLSKALKIALGVEPNTLPMFIYKMRELGYPRGWLEEAKVSHSGVILYDSLGQPVLDDEIDEEEGEILPEGAKDKFDASKIIEYAGFNVPMEENCVDEAARYGCPPMSCEQSKESMIQGLGSSLFKAYKKKSSKPLAASDDEGDSQEANETDNSAKKRRYSPSIEEMEEKKRRLLSALDCEEGSSGSSGKRSESPQTSVGQVRAVNYGTPVLQSVSPYSKLPRRECFSIHVSDVINFENLPNATGKYETMTSLITKIRETVTKIQNE